MNFTCYFIACSLQHCNILLWIGWFFFFFSTKQSNIFLNILQVMLASSEIFMCCCFWSHTEMKIVHLFLILYFIFVSFIYYTPSLLSLGDLASLTDFHTGLCQKSLWIWRYLEPTYTYNCWLLWKRATHCRNVASFYKKHTDPSLIGLIHLCARHYVF